MPTSNKEKSPIIAGTGHRPVYLRWGYSNNSADLNQLKSEIARGLHIENPQLVISGMASGFDTYLAEVALEEGFNLAAYAVKGQEASWPEYAKAHRQDMLDRAYTILYFNEPNIKDAYLKRDRAMVDACSKVFCLWNPKIEKGGTYYTVNYASEKKIRIVNFWHPSYEKSD